METENIENLDIETKMFDNNKILEINGEKPDLYLFFKDSLNINKLNNIKYFQNEKDILQIKKTIDTLLKEKKFIAKYDEKSQILTLTFKPTTNENDDFQITLKENKNQIIDNMFTQINDLVNSITLKQSESSQSISLNENIPSISSSRLKENVKIKILNKEYLQEKENITFLTFFPSGITITGSWDGKLKIYKTFDIKKKFSEYKAHNSCIMYISIKDDNEFASCSDIEIKIFNIKEEGNKFIFEIKLFFDNAHNDVINKILYSKNNNYLFSCSMDNCIKIWDLDNNNENKKIINEDDNIFCFDFLNNEQIIISSGVYGTNIYEIIFNNNPLLVNSNKILNFKEATCLSRFGITKMYDDDKLKEFIVCGNFINIISLNENKIIFTKKFNFTIWDCCFIKDNENEELILIGNDNIVQILSKNQNKYEKGITMNEFKNKNYFRIIDMGKDVFFIFSSCNDLFSFNYSNSQNYENFDETIKIF